MQKKCRKCGVEKDFGEFPKRKDGKNGLRADCRKCRDEVYAFWYLKNETRNKAVNAAWHERNKDKTKAAIKAFKQRNRDDILRSEAARGRKRCKYLHDGYVRGVLVAKMKVKPSLADIPQELIDLKRIQLQITREIRNQAQ